MWRSQRWSGRVLGAVALASVTLVGWTAPLPTSAPEVVGVSRPQAPLADAARSVLGDLEQPVQRAVRSADRRALLTGWQVRPTPTWLDIHNGRARAANRGPALWRYEF